MYECTMKDEIHESIYDYCEKIYDAICYNNNNCNDDIEFLKADLNNFIENEIEKMTQYDINAILMSYVSRWVFLKRSTQAHRFPPFYLPQKL